MVAVEPIALDRREKNWLLELIFIVDFNEMDDVSMSNI